MSPRTTDRAGRRGRPRLALVELPDGRRVWARVEDGLPTFGYRQAPTGLVTRRQLRAAGKRPAGQDPVAQIKWRKRGVGICWAGLYRLDLAAPKRAATPAQLAAARRATAARLAALARRRRCPDCGVDPGYALPAWLPCSSCHPPQGAAA
jgi:hypothetical protein